MTKEELAAILNGRKYCDEMTKSEEKQAMEAGLVVVFGYSEDYMELRGAIEDEVGAYQGTRILVDGKGLLFCRDDIEIEAHTDEWLADYFTRRAAAKTIDALWNKEGYYWIYRTDIPHATFEVMEDDEKYCRGIVFALADL